MEDNNAMVPWHKTGPLVCQRNRRMLRYSTSEAEWMGWITDRACYDVGELGAAGVQPQTLRDGLDFPKGSYVSTTAPTASGYPGNPRPLASLLSADIDI
jgi:hypothetical protein